MSTGSETSAGSETRTGSETTENTRIDAVVFDLGNVLVRWDPYLPYLGRMDRGAVDTFFAEIDFPRFNQQQDAGRSWAHARLEIGERFPQHLAAFDLYLDNFADSLPGPVPGSAEIVRELATRGVRVFGLTNWSAETYRHAAPAAPAIGLLEDVVVSGQEGLAKPDPRIFALVSERFGVRPACTVFTDDSPANVSAAQAAGYRGVLFTDAEGLRRDLAALGLPVGAPPVPT